MTCATTGKETQKTQCVQAMFDREVVWAQPRIQCLHPGGLFRCMWSRSSCFSQMLNLPISSLSWCLFFDVKTNGEVDLTLELNYPPLENFCHISGLHSPPTGQEILYFLACCYHYSRNAKDRALHCTLQKILHLIQGSVCLESHWFQTALASLSSYPIALFRAAIHLGIGLRS